MNTPSNTGGVALWLICAVWTLLALTPDTVEAACGGYTDVSSEAELDSAIASFNSQPGPCIFGIRFAGDVLLTASTSPIDNSNQGVELVIDGQGASLDAQNLPGVRPLHIAYVSTVHVTDLTIENGNAPPSELAGGIFNAGILTLSDCTIANNTADTSGGIHNDGLLTVSRCSIFGNSSTGLGASGGGIGNSIGRTVTVTDSIFAGNSTVRGGGLYNNNGTAIVERTLFTNNTASLDGGAIYLSNGGQVVLINSTVSGNSAQLAGGGGIYVASGLMKLTHVTVTGNTGGGIPNSSGALRLNNSVFSANPDGGDCRSFNINVTIKHSLLNDAGVTACGLDAANPDEDGNIIGQDPLLDPLQANGGPTDSHALDEGSPAVDAGDDALAVDLAEDPLEHDQRGPGYPRRTGYGVDMGAYEAPGALFLDGFEER